MKRYRRFRLEENSIKETRLTEIETSNKAELIKHKNTHTHIKPSWKYIEDQCEKKDKIRREKIIIIIETITINKTHRHRQNH